MRWTWLIRRGATEPSDPVKRALAESSERKQHAGEFLADIEKDSHLVQKALARNGFEEAVRRTFVRRHA